jgi:hypothetical protein
MSENATSYTPPSPTELLGLKLKTGVGRPKKNPDASSGKKVEKKIGQAAVVTGLTEVVGVELSFAPTEFITDEDGRAIVTLTIKQAKKLYHDLEEQLP